MPDPLSSDSFGQGRRAMYDAPAPSPPARSRGGRFLLVGLPLIAVFAAFGSIMWLAYVDATPGSASGQPPLVTADTSPVKIRPDDPGGRAVADQGELRALIGDDELAAQAERLLPPPEEPVTPEEAAGASDQQQAATGTTTEGGAQTGADGAEAPITAQEQSPAPDQGQSGQTAAEAAPSRDTEAEASAALDALLAEVTGRGGPVDGASSSGRPQAEEESPGPSAAQPETTSTEAADGSGSATPPAPSVPAAASEAPQETAALGTDQTARPDASDDTGTEAAPVERPQEGSQLRVVTAPTDTQAGAGATYRIQLAAVREESDARRAWTLFQDDLGDVVGGLDPIIERADTANGTFYRVQVGPFANLAAAESLCEDLKQRNASCFVIRR